MDICHLCFEGRGRMGQGTQYTRNDGTWLKEDKVLDWREA